MSNNTTIGDKFRTYLKHPGSFIVMLLVMLSAIITCAGPGQHNYYDIAVTADRGSVRNLLRYFPCGVRGQGQ